MNVAILFASFGPYHKARLEALAAQIRERGGRLWCFRFTVGSEEYSWDPCEPHNASTVTLCRHCPSGPLDSLKVAWALFKRLRGLEIHTAFLPSYSPLPNLLCIFAARLARCRIVLMCDSWSATEKARGVKRFLKRLIFRLFDSALVAGTRHIEFAIAYGIPQHRVFSGYDVVDVDYFEMKANTYLRDPCDSLFMASLPRRFFLNVGRFVPKKNLLTLIEAYALLATETPQLDIALVLVGDGECVEDLRRRAGELNIPWLEGAVEGHAPEYPVIIRFPFMQVSVTPLFFAKCEAFILPSSCEEWGLVVNEAMACGAPVVVSQFAGCAPDLVEEGENGFTFDPSSSRDLVGLMARFVEDPTLHIRLGKRGREIVRKWTPETFARNAIMAMSDCGTLWPPKEAAVKVTFLVESLALAAGGTALEVATLARELSRCAGIEVTVLTFQEEGPIYDIGGEAKLVILPSKGRVGLWLSTWLDMRAILAEQDTVFVTGVWGPMDGLGMRLCWPQGARVYVRVCGMLEPYILARNSGRKRLARSIYVDRNLRSASGIIVNSSSEAGRIVSLDVKAPIGIIPNGVPAPQGADRCTLREELGISKERTVVLYLGRVHPKKGLHLWLDSWRQYSSKDEIARDQAVLLVAGGFSTTEYRLEIERLAAPFISSGNIFFLGELAGSEKEVAFAAADVFLLPSESEGLPNAVLEAMARGLPAIVTEGCNLPEVAAHQAGVVVQYSRAGMERAMDWIVQSQGCFSDYGENALALVEAKFSLERTVSTYEAIVRSPEAFPAI